MADRHTLTTHRAIQAWATGRRGTPAIIPDNDRLGQKKPRLALRFTAPDRPRGLPRVDQGASPVSWNAWFAELDRQQLALRVSGTTEPSYELVERKSLN